MKALRQQDGFAVVELLITLIILGTIFGAFMTTFLTINSIIKKSTDVNKVNSAAFGKMQEYENKSFTSLPTTTPANSLVEVEDFSSSISSTVPKPVSAKVYINTNSTTLKQVVVRITFGSADSQQIIEYGNFIQRDGVGR